MTAIYTIVVDDGMWQVCKEIRNEDKPGKQEVINQGIAASQMDALDLAISWIEDNERYKMRARIV